MSSSLDESKNSATTESESSKTNIDYPFLCLAWKLQYVTAHCCITAHCCMSSLFLPYTYVLTSKTSLCNFVYLVIWSDEKYSEILQFTIPGGRHAVHHAGLLQEAGAGRVLRAAAAATTASIEAKIFARIVLRNLEHHQSGTSTWTPSRGASSNKGLCIDGLLGQCRMNQFGFRSLFTSQQFWPVQTVTEGTPPKV